MKHSADVTVRDNSGWTPLHSTCYIYNITIVVALLNHNANVNAKNNDGGTPLNMACRCSEKDVVVELLDHGANVNTTDNDGWTPLHDVCLGDTGTKEMVVELLKRGANVNAEDNYGNTPLYYAHKDRKKPLLYACTDGLYYARKDNKEEIAVELLNHGANNVENIDEKTAYDVSGEEMKSLINQLQTKLH